jgi:glycosyltransferase involved in cell wall biosynthesis
MVSLEPLREGKAAMTHVLRLAEALGAEGIDVALSTRRVAAGTTEGVARRVLALLASQVKAGTRLAASDCLYLRSHPLAAPLAALAHLLRRPVVHEVNGLMDDIGVTYGLPACLTRLLKRLQSWQYRHASALLAVTPGLAREVRALAGPETQVSVVSNGVDVDLFHPAAPGGPVIDGDYVVLFGGLVAWHGVDDVMLALADPAWPSGVKVVVAGDGPALAKLRSAAAGDARMLFTGHLPQPELAGLAARSLAVLAPIQGHGGRARYGVAPLKLFEGMASGRPVIATDLPYAAEIVMASNCGLLVGEREPAAIASAVAYLAAHPTEADAMGQRGRAAAVANHRWADKAHEAAIAIAMAASWVGKG